MLTARVLAKVLCRVTAIIALLLALGELTDWVAQVIEVIDWGDGDDYLWLSVILAYPAALLFMAAWLWTKAAIVAAWILGHDLQDDPDEPDVPTG